MTEIVELAVGTVGLSVTAGPDVHVGRLIAPAGDDVRAQVKVMVPAYPPVPDTVSVEDALAPAAMLAGFVVVIVNAGGITMPVTVIVAVPVAEA